MKTVLFLFTGNYYRSRFAEVLHPQRETIEMLESTMRAIGPDTFAAQYQQAPVQPGGGMIKREWIRRYDHLPELTPACQIIQSWDCANAGGAESDWSVCTTWLSHENGNYYLIDLQRGRWDYPTLESKAIGTAQRHCPNTS
jgi:phage terminase large subunit-like protein